MKKLIYYIFAASMICGCISAKKQLQRGEYDYAIQTAVRKLIKKPDKQKMIVILDQAYKNANQQDLDRIAFLKKSGEPDIWDEVFDAYGKMKRRQDYVKTLQQKVLTAISYKYINYDQEIIEAKKKAAEYFYAHGDKLLDKGDKASARMAYDEFIKVKNYYQEYKDVDMKIDTAKRAGISHVLFKMKNLSGLPLPATFEEQLTKISLNDLNTLWINYDTKEVEKTVYDYFILVNIKGIEVSPEAVKETQTTETKEVQDGFQYVLDKNGNVMKDSLGNDIKVLKYKTITCLVIETLQKKTAIISGTIEYINMGTTQIIKTDPISAQAFFEHNSAKAVGDIEALKPETRKKLGSQPIPFPTDPAMILMADDILKNMTKSIIANNKGLIF
jgi:hypothetical protein